MSRRPGPLNEHDYYSTAENSTEPINDTALQPEPSSTDGLQVTFSSFIILKIILIMYLLLGGQLIYHIE